MIFPLTVDRHQVASLGHTVELCISPENLSLGCTLTVISLKGEGNIRFPIMEGNSSDIQSTRPAEYERFPSWIEPGRSITLSKLLSLCGGTLSAFSVGAARCDTLKG
ncbi:hypothetical protein NQZ68_031022 [Dissostichus eleginoides]|nr:hypothetical protein NQZ68_031022 [Dissostichus eleginoides]